MVGTFLFFYAGAEVFLAMLGRWLDSDETRWIAMQPRNMVVIFAVVLFGAYRALAFHPLSGVDYGRWLYYTPWRHPRPLPFGPVQLTLQDVLLVGLGVLACHGSLKGQWVVPQAFLLSYLTCLGGLFAVCGLRWWTYLLVLGLGGVVWLSPWSDAAATAMAIALYPAARVALSASLAGFPWPEAVVSSVARFSTSMKTKRKRPWYDKNELGWPFDLLQRPVEVPRRNWLHLAIETLLIGWVVHAFVSLIPGEIEEPAGLVPLTYLTLGLCLQRLFKYCWHFRPPISLWGRLLTGRWIIPGYDQVLVGPLCVALAGLVLPFTLERLGVPTRVWLPVNAALLILAHRGIGPSWPRWLLTGNYRLVPGITNRQEFEEI